jgi:hypothetical protein
VQERGIGKGVPGSHGQPDMTIASASVGGDPFSRGSWWRAGRYV